MSKDMQLARFRLLVIFITTLITFSYPAQADEITNIFKMAGDGKVNIAHYEEIALNECNLKAIAYQQKSDTKVTLYCNENVHNLSEQFLSSFKDLQSYSIQDKSVILLTFHIGAHSERAVLVNPLSGKVNVDLKSDWPIGIKLDENQITFNFEQDGHKKSLKWPSNTDS